MRAVHKAFQRAAKAAKALVSYADRMDEARNRSYQDLIKAAERSSAAFSTQNTGGADFTLGSPGSVRPSMSLSPGGGASPALRKTADDEALSEVGDEVGGLDGVRESAHLALTMINRAHWLTVVRAAPRRAAHFRVSPRFALSRAIKKTKPPGNQMVS